MEKAGEVFEKVKTGAKSKIGYSEDYWTKIGAKMGGIREELENIQKATRDIEEKVYDLPELVERSIENLEEMKNMELPEDIELSYEEEEYSLQEKHTGIKVENLEYRLANLEDFSDFMSRKNL
ncbi:MAG: hypothetical protein MUP58_01975 [Candidatus Nanohaloarchaeota archaeon QJJ-9]|nr:hypothetical protein [Candidatus Nanohaloarchaeota archaeon QJJ-9]